MMMMICDFSSLGCLVLILMISGFARGTLDECVPSPFCEEMGNQTSDELVTIKSPFRLRNFQAEHCGRPGFELSCTNDNRTVLHLPNFPNNLYVQNIRYSDKVLEVSLNPEPESIPRLELPSNLLSRTPFSFRYKFSRLTLMNCSERASSADNNGMIECGHRGHGKNSDIYAMKPNSQIGYNPLMLTCTKMYSYNAPVDPDFVSLEYFELTWAPSFNPGLQLPLAPEPEPGSGSVYEDGGGFSSYYYSSPDVNSNPLEVILIIAGTVRSVEFVICVAIGVCALYIYTSDKQEIENQIKIEKFLDDYMASKPSRYSYADIKKITDDFKIKLGEGAFGTVFKGKLSSDVLVAVKILTIPYSIAGNGEDFVNEVATMGRIHHVNVVRLVGFCADGFRRALVYELLSNHTLDKYISRNQSLLTWTQSQAIALGISKGIDYLHQGCDQRILHFDIKPHNILLDRNFTPKICDFGLAKLCSKDQNTVSMSTTRGTIGYIAPEVFSRNFGKVSYKSDVYSFGILLLEMVAGRKNTASSEEENGAEEIYYPEWIYNLLEEGEDLRIQVEEEGDGEIAKRLAIVGLWCIQWHPAGRPTMKHVVQMLEGESGELRMPPNPFAGSSNVKISARQRAAFELETIAE